MEFRCRLGTPGGRSSKGFTSRTAKTGCVASWKRRVFTSCHCSARACRRRFDSAADAAAVSAGRSFSFFNQELATLLKAGMPLVQSLDILRQRVSNVTFKAVLDAIYERRRRGRRFRMRSPNTGRCSRRYAASLMAGERSGNLDAVIRRYGVREGHWHGQEANDLRPDLPGDSRDDDVRADRHHRPARRPAFSDFYGNFDRKLPASTEIVVAISNVAVTNIWLILAVVAGVVAGTLLQVRHPAQRRTFHRFLLTLPWLGETVRKFATAQVARTLATLLGGGIPLVNAIEIAGDRCRTDISPANSRMRGGAQEGQSFAAALRERASFRTLRSR